MRKITFFTIVGFLACNFSFGQNVENYSALIKEAWNLYGTKDYLKSAEKYSEAFVALGNKGTVDDRYNAACSYALANMSDSSFVQLFKIARNANYTNLGHIITDPDLAMLHADKRWGELIDIIKANKARAEANLNKPLVACLDSIYQEDQQYRQQISAVENKSGWNSAEMNALWAVINKKDSINLVMVKKILDERGWLGPDVIGDQGNSTLFLVIQHSNIITQEKYLPMMREAVQKRNARPSELALLEDRVALGTGKMQIYGSQVSQDPQTGKYYVLPLIDPDNVDKRRAEVGLGPIQDYISSWGMTWNVEEYKKQLLEIEAKQKK